MIIAVDFDGTIVEHRYPDIGPELPFAIETLKRLRDEHHKLILWTVREGRLLDEAVRFCREGKAGRTAPRVFVSTPYRHFGRHDAVAERDPNNIFACIKIRRYVIMIIVHEMVRIAAVRRKIAFGDPLAIHKQLINTKPADRDFK